MYAAYLAIYRRRRRACAEQLIWPLGLSLCRLLIKVLDKGARAGVHCAMSSIGTAAGRRVPWAAPGLRQANGGTFCCAVRKPWDQSRKRVCTEQQKSLIAFAIASCAVRRGCGSTCWARQ
jgi:hypothetical protein